MAPLEKAVGRHGSYSSIPSRPFSPGDQEAIASMDPMRVPCFKARRVIVKVGTSVVTREKDQRLALGRLGSLVESLEHLVRENKQVILVTSGATAVGRQKLRFQQVLNSSPLEMQMLGLSSLQARAAAAAGQSGLMALYDSLFQMMDMQCSQFLVTSRDFKNEDFKRNLNATVDNLLRMNVVPVINENDSISSTEESESVFTDNDGLAAKLAHQLQADLVVLMTDVDGVYTGPPSEPDSRLIDVWCPPLHDSIIQLGEKSQHGRGGMGAKIRAAWYGAESGATVVIMNGQYPENLVKLCNGEKVGTLFNIMFAEALAIKEEHARRDGSIGHRSQAPATSPTEMARAARQESRVLSALSTEERSSILMRIASALESRVDEIIAANQQDIATATNVIDNHLINRLVLKPKKISQVAEGIRQLANMDEPIGNVLSRTELAEGLELKKISSPIGVVLIIFEARPEALPQIASLAIRSGNGLLLKGGKEATKSNACLHNIITSCLAPVCGPGLIGLVTSRSEIDDLLQLKEYIDLVVPRGSNKLVSYIQSHTSIPVLGHADGICHIYVDKDADLDEACKICVDAKVDYPAACNAVEKILVHRAHEQLGIFQLQSALREAGATVHGTEATMTLLGAPEAPSLRHEYGTPAVTVDLVDSMSEAIEKIHKYGSGHTEAICTKNEETAEEFLKLVDSACVLSNCSTRFSDGFRFGLGAEVGISTSRIHARGPVGVEGLMTTRFQLRGHGQVVAKDTGVQYTHKKLPITATAKKLPVKNGKV